MSLSLYHIKNEYLQAFHELSSIEGLSADVIKDSLAAIECNLEDKAINVAAYIQNLEAEALSMKDYEARMSEKRKHIDNKISRLKEYLKESLTACGKKSVKSAELSITLKDGITSVVIEDMRLIPKDYITQQVVESIDKKAIKTAISAGKEVSGARLEPVVSLIIK